jgi:KUP system potassium uptake protein
MTTAIARSDIGRATTVTRLQMPVLTLGAIGVVFGDIGTSPLYAMKEVFVGHHPLAVDQLRILGVLSLMFWSLMLIVTVKYVGIILRADNKGEGGELVAARADPAQHGRTAVG